VRMSPAGEYRIEEQAVATKKKGQLSPILKNSGVGRNKKFVVSLKKRNPAKIRRGWRPPMKEDKQQSR